MPKEEFDSAGPNAGEIKTDSHFKYIVDKRVEQGFTVYQSEPLKANLNVAEGIIAEKNIEISKFVLEKLSEEYKKSKLTVDGKVSSGVVVNFIDDIKEDDKEEIFGVKESDIL